MAAAGNSGKRRHRGRGRGRGSSILPEEVEYLESFRKFFESSGRPVLWKETKDIVSILVPSKNPGISVAIRLRDTIPSKIVATLTKPEIYTSRFYETIIENSTDKALLAELVFKYTSELVTFDEDDISLQGDRAWKSLNKTNFITAISLLYPYVEKSYLSVNTVQVPRKAPFIPFIPLKLFEDISKDIILMWAETGVPLESIENEPVTDWAEITMDSQIESLFKSALLYNSLEIVNMILDFMFHDEDEEIDDAVTIDENISWTRSAEVMNAILNKLPGFQFNIAGTELAFKFIDGFIPYSGIEAAMQFEDRNMEDILNGFSTAIGEEDELTTGKIICRMLFNQLNTWPIDAGFIQFIVRLGPENDRPYSMITAWRYLISEEGFENFRGEDRMRLIELIKTITRASEEAEMAEEAGLEL